MMRFYRKYILLSLATIFLIGVPLAASATNDKPKKRAPAVLSMTVYKQVNRATEALHGENYDLALDILQQLLIRSKRLTPYDEAKIHQLLMSTYIGKNDYDSGAEAGEQAVALSAFGQEESIFLHSRLFYVYFFMERYHRAIEHLRDWFALDEAPSADALFAAAQVYAILESNQTALEYAQRGLDIALSTPRVSIKENWYQLVISLHLRLEQYSEAGDLLEEAIALWPQKPFYFLQLSAVYHELKNEVLAFAVMSIAYRNLVISEQTDLLRLVQHYRYHEYPEQGARILRVAISNGVIERSYDHLQLLSQTLIQAREWKKAELALLDAADMATTGSIWMQLCQLSFQDERWADTRRYCRLSLEKGDLSEKEGMVWYLLALAQYYDQQFSAALSSFERCVSWQSTKDNCLSWRAQLLREVSKKPQDTKLDSEVEFSRSS